MRLPFAQYARTGFDTSWMANGGKLDGQRWQNDWAADSYVPNEHGGDDSQLDLRATVPSPCTCGRRDDARLRSSLGEQHCEREGRGSPSRRHHRDRPRSFANRPGGLRRPDRRASTRATGDAARSSGSGIGGRAVRFIADLVACPICTGWWASLVTSMIWPGRYRLRRALPAVGLQVLLTFAERLMSEQGRVAAEQGDAS